MAGLPITFCLLLAWSFPARAGSFEFGKIQGPSPHKIIPEASGLEMSRTNGGILWTHNDSGDSARIFALDTLGKHLATFNLKGAKALDWEDIAIGPGPSPNQDYIYIADLGDNFSARPLKTLYRVPEPDLRQYAPGREHLLTHFDSFTFYYPDGKRDAETLVFDPISQRLYVVTKREDSVRLYQFPKKLNPSSAMQLKLKGKLDLKLVTGGDILEVTGDILLKTYEAVYYWRRPEGLSLWKTLTLRPEKLPYVPEPQGEGICWAPNGNGYFTISEIRYGQLPNLMFYPKSRP